MTPRLKLELCLLIGLGAAVLGGLLLRPAPPRRHLILSWEGHAREIRQTPRKGGLDVTLFHVSDVHAGAEACDNYTGFASLDRCRPIAFWHHRLIDRMLTLAGTRFPEEAGGGAVQPAKALIVTGDVTQDGKEAEWAAYLRLFGPGGVLQVTDTHLTYAAWNLEFNDWWWIHSEPINGHRGPETLKILRGAPWVPYPQSAD